MGKRALLVGINDYPKNSLHGSLNDVELVEALLVARYGFHPTNDILRCMQSEAKKGTILDNLRWLVRGAGPEDLRLFYFAGHGAQLRVPMDSNEPDGLDEVLCAHGFDESAETSIFNRECTEIFASLPVGARLVWICDSCYSGGMPPVRGLKSRDAETVRSFPMSYDALTATGATPLPLRSVIGRSTAWRSVRFIGACRENEKAIERMLGGQVHGALTYHLVGELQKAEMHSMAIRQVLEHAQGAMRADGFMQSPVLYPPDGGTKPLFIA